MDQLLSDIDAYCAAAGIKPTTFGAYVANDGEFVARLERQRDRQKQYAERVYAYMRTHPVASDEAAGEEAA